MSANDLTLRRRRALYRASHRGSKELDILLGRFAASVIDQMDEREIGCLERLIETPDPDIGFAVFEGHVLGDASLDALLDDLRRFHGLEAAASPTAQ